MSNIEIIKSNSYIIKERNYSNYKNVYEIYILNVTNTCFKYVLNGKTFLKEKSTFDNEYIVLENISEFSDSTLLY